MPGLPLVPRQLSVGPSTWKGVSVLTHPQPPRFLVHSLIHSHICSFTSSSSRSASISLGLCGAHMGRGRGTDAL